MGVDGSHHTHTRLSSHQPSCFLLSLLADAVPPALVLTGATPIRAEAGANAGNAKVPNGFPAMEARDADAPEGSPTPVITCRATIQGQDQEVTPASTEFPYGSTAVACTAKDAASNESPAVSFVVVVACVSGYSVRDDDGTCKSELSSSWQVGSQHCVLMGRNTDREASERRLWWFPKVFCWKPDPARLQ
jgi:hypothetical protein